MSRTVLGQGADWISKLPAVGVHTVTAAEASANAATIATGKSNAAGFIVQIYRSGGLVGGDAAVGISAGILTVADGSAYSVTASDVINWIVF